MNAMRLSNMFANLMNFVLVSEDRRPLYELLFCSACIYTRFYRHTVVLLFHPVSCQVQKIWPDLIYTNEWIWDDSYFIRKLNPKCFLKVSLWFMCFSFSFFFLWTFFLLSLILFPSLQCPSPPSSHSPSSSGGYFFFHLHLAFSALPCPPPGGIHLFPDTALF